MQVYNNKSSTYFLFNQSSAFNHFHVIRIQQHLPSKWLIIHLVCIPPRVPPNILLSLFCYKQRIAGLWFWFWFWIPNKLFPLISQYLISSHVRSPICFLTLAIIAYRYIKLIMTSTLNKTFNLKKFNSDIFSLYLAKWQHTQVI